MFPEDFSRALENAGGLSPSFTDRYVVEELIHASCTRGNFVPASGVSFRAVKKKKKLDSSNGTRGDGTSRWISFYLERRFATFCQRKLKDRMLTEEQLRFCEKKKEERNQIHVTKISRMDRSNHFVNRFIKQNEISFICTIICRIINVTHLIYIYIYFLNEISLYNCCNTV